MDNNEWQQLSQKALQALTKGDEQEAIRLWRSCLTLIKDTNAEQSTEKAQVFHYLGKTLARSGDLGEPITLMQEAEKIYMEVDPGNSSLKMLKYDLGNMLSKAGKSDEATDKYKFAMGIVDEVTAQCLQGERHEDLKIKSMVKMLQKQGLASELNTRELNRIKTLLVESGRADEGDDESIHPFDLLYKYYATNEKRVRTDLCAAWEIPDNADQRISKIMNLLNELLRRELFTSDDIVTAEEEQQCVGIDNKFFCLILDHENRDAMPLRGEIEVDIIYTYNNKLAQENDSRRFLRLASYDDREMVMLLRISTVAKLYFAGAAYIFENPSLDLEPGLFPIDLHKLS